MKNKQLLIAIPLLTILLLVFPNSKTFSQNQPQEQEEPFATPLIGASFGWVFPGGHMSKTYKSFLSVGATGMYKTNQNWIWGMDGNFLFGNNSVKGDRLKEILKDLMNQQGFITGTGGVDAEVSAYNRGYTITAKVGKLIPVTKKNPNSGVFFTAGAGFLQNQTIFDIGVREDGVVPLLEGDYRRGYDGQMRGFQLSEFIGYMHMSSSGNQYFNFYIGFEITQAWTKYTRDYIFYLKGPDNNTYFDVMYAIKGVWMFPLKSRKATDYYYY